MQAYLQIVLHLDVQSAKLVGVIQHELVILVSYVAHFVGPIATHVTSKFLVHDANPVYTLTNIVKLQLHHRRLHGFQQMQHASHAVVNVLVKRMYIFPAL